MWTVGRRRELRVRTIREEKERDEVAAAELRCRIIPTTKNIYGRRFLCSRLQSGICAAAAPIFRGNHRAAPPVQWAARAPFTFGRHRRRRLVSLHPTKSANKEERKEGREGEIDVMLCTDRERGNA